MEKVAKEDLEKVAKRVLAKLSAREEGATLLTLSGDLGAGKTTLVQALARELGITEAIQSPTYVLMKRYELQGQLFDALIHIDAYRLENAEQFAALEPESLFKAPRTLVALEWPEKVEGALPKADLALTLSSDGAGEGERYISIDSE